MPDEIRGGTMEIKIKIKPSVADRYALLNELLEVACNHVNKHGDVEGKIIGN